MNLVNIGVILFIHPLWLFIAGTSFVRDLHNLTIIYKPHAYIYHLCQTSDSKRIRWEYEPSINATNQTDTHCQQFFNHSDCFDFYYGSSTSLLVIKESAISSGKFTCHVRINATYQMKSIGWIDVKLPLGKARENDLAKLALSHNVPFIVDRNDSTSFGKRTPINGVFHTECQSVESSYPINFLWIHLRNNSKGLKTLQYVQHDGDRIIIDNDAHSSSLLIHSVDLLDGGDYVCIASNALGRSFSSIRSLIISDTQIIPILSSTNIASRSVVLHWNVSEENTNRFDHFIVYYRRVNHFEHVIDAQDYKQILVNNFTYSMNGLMPYTKYEFQVKGFIDSTLSDYSNSMFIETSETLPEKVENLRGYVCNETSVVIHWSAVPSTNAPHFYYVLYYTTITSLPFYQWPSVIIRSYPFHILSLVLSSNIHLFIRVASVNVKGSILSDLYIINHSPLDMQLIPTIDKFQCFVDDENQHISLQWTMDEQSRLNITRYVLYYLDLTESPTDFMRQLVMPIENHTFDVSLLKLNSSPCHILRLSLGIIDQNDRQFPMISSPIYLTLTSNFGSFLHRIDEKCYLFDSEVTFFLSYSDNRTGVEQFS